MEPGKFGADMPLLTTKQFIVPAPETIQEARAAGAVPGTMLSAPLAAAKGPIDLPAESLVVVTVKKFWDSPTAKAIKGVLITAVAAVSLALGATFLTTWSNGRSIFEKGAVDWRKTEIACEVAGGGVIVAALMGWARKRDNNPVQ